LKELRSLADNSEFWIGIPQRENLKTASHFIS
jgi:hypothetical protein